MYIDVISYVVPIPDAMLGTTPSFADSGLAIAQAPSVPNAVFEVYSIDVRCDGQLVVDATNEVKILEIVPVSVAGEDGTAIFTGAAGAAGDLKTAVMDLGVPVNLFQGTCRLARGEALKIQLDTTTPDTAGSGYSIVVTGRVVEWNGN